MRRGPSLLVPILIVVLLGHVCRVASPVPLANSYTSKGGAADHREWLVGDMAEEEEEEFLMDSEINRRLLPYSSILKYAAVHAAYSKDPAFPCGYKGQQSCEGHGNRLGKPKQKCNYYNRGCNRF